MRTPGLLSGTEVATQHSYHMIGIVLLAVLVDRTAVTFRTLAIAAIAVRLLEPEAVVRRSFQMSFAATLGSSPTIGTDCRTLEHLPPALGRTIPRVRAARTRVRGAVGV